MDRICLFCGVPFEFSLEVFIRVHRLLQNEPIENIPNAGETTIPANKIKDEPRTVASPVPEDTVVLRRAGGEGTNSNKGQTEETVSFTITSPKKAEAEPRVDTVENRLSASYTLPKRQSSSASASPVPFYKNFQAQQHRESPLHFHAKVPSPTSATAPAQRLEEPVVVSATVSLNEPPQSASLNSSPRHFGKKSLFDLDNANSLSLADKLRNEANKYTDLSASNKSLNCMNEAPQPPERTKREIITGSTQSLNENVILNSNSGQVATAATATVAAAPKQLQYAERRPSWRLKFDAGSKVLACCITLM